jgi:hypothetical protein
LIDSTARRPIPGQAKICSVMTAPLTSSARLMPMIVTTGISPFGAAWTPRTRARRRPFARAVRT